MDLFPTFLELANISKPVDHVLDGTSLVSSFLHNKTFDRFLLCVYAFFLIQCSMQIFNVCS